jgi:hypothetical protein
MPNDQTPMALLPESLGLVWSLGFGPSLVIASLVIGHFLPRNVVMNLAPPVKRAEGFPRWL